MFVIVDTSVVYAAVLRDSRVRGTILRFGIEWAAPPLLREEVRRALPDIVAKARRPRAEVEEVIDTVLAQLGEVDVSRNDPEYAVALELIGSRDESDVEFVAAALKYDAIGVWSLDKDFDGIAGVPRLTTASVERLIELVGEGFSPGAAR